MKNIDWQSLDWRKRNVDLARELNCGTSTVCRWRQRLNKPQPSFRLTQEDKDKATNARAEALKAGRYEKAYREKSEKMKGKPHGRDDRISESHLAKKEEHPHAKSHKVISPEGIAYQFDNAQNFVRENPELFSPEDIKERRTPSKNIYTRAAHGIHRVSSGNRDSWKGWTKA